MKTAMPIVRPGFLFHKKDITCAKSHEEMGVIMEINNENILKIAIQQSAVDAGCLAEDFLREENVIVPSAANPGARKYLTLPFDCNLISYGNNVVASINEKYRGIVSAYISRFEAWRCFETPNLHLLNDAMQKEGRKVCFMAVYYLPDIKSLKALTCPYELRILHPCDFRNCTRISGGMHCVKSGKNSMFWEWGRMTAASLSGFPAVRRTVKQCGRSGLMSFPNIGESILRQPLQAVWRLRY